MALGRWKQLDPSQRLIATASYQKAKRSDRVLTLTLTLRDALPCTNQSRRFNQLHYARFLASSSRPNISGGFTVGDRGFHPNPDPTGPFESFKEGVSKFPTQLSAEADANGFSFDASRSSAIYGTSNVVQPASLKCLACIKT